VSGALDRRLTALADAIRLADGRVEPASVEAARAIVRRAGERLGLGLDATVVALAGPTGAGKSSLFNLLAGRELSRVGVRRPTTSATTAARGSAADPALLDWLDVPTRHALDAGASKGLVLIDLPDFDSVEVSHRMEVDRLVRLVDLLVWVVDPQKYADAALHERYLRPLAGHAASMIVVLNQVDRLGGQAGRARDDLRQLLATSGLASVPVLAVSARTGEGSAPLRRIIEERVQSRAAALARLSGDVTGVAHDLRAAVGDGRAAGVGRHDRELLVASLAEAAGVPAVVRAVDAAHRHRGALAAGLPWVSWLRRLRPDPLRRLGVGPSPREDVRTSLPRATPVQRAQVDSAIRTAAATAATGLQEPWPSLARRAATAKEPELADRLDRAIAGADLRMRPPRWWTPAGWAQRLLAALSVAGLVWLAALAGLGYLQLDDAMPTPDIGGLPVPTALLLGGLVAGALLAFVARVSNRIGAGRRARRARRALHDRITAVADELILGPLQAELGAHGELTRALDAAVDERTRLSRRASPAPGAPASEPTATVAY
jgi:GTP-binding protein EngB required for normal cell division